MKDVEAARILALLQGNWRHVEITRQTSAVWLEHLADVPADEGVAVAHALIRGKHHFPTIAEFREEWQAYRRLHPPTPRGELTTVDVVVPPATAKANLRRLRKVLAEHPIKRACS